MLTTIIIVMVIYFAAMVGISFLGKKHADTFDEYLNMGRSGSVIMLMGAAIGAHIGNGLVVGGAGEGASVGISGAMYGLGCCLSYIFLLLFVKYMYKGNYLSLSEYLRKRYDSEVCAQIYNVATTLCYLGILGAQLMAGKALFVALGLNGTVGVIVIALVVFLYSQISGLWGAFATSVVQIFIIAIGLIVTVIYIIASGGWSYVTDAVASGAVSQGFTSSMGEYGFSTSLALVLPTALSVITDQATWQRINAAKSDKTAFTAHLLSAIVMIPLAFAPVLIGMYGNARFGATGNDAFFTVVMQCLPPIIAALIIVAVIAAVMSTIDAALIGFSAVLIKDLYKRHIDKNASDQKLSHMTLILNIVVVVFGVLIALYSDSIVNVLSNTYLILCGACVVPFVGGLIWKRGTAAGSAVSSIVGTLFVVGYMLGLFSWPLEAVTLLIPGLIVYIVVSLCTKPAQKAA